MDVGEAIAAGRTALGIELGSTRIKAVLVGPDHAPLAVGSSDWENQFVERRWTYSLDAVWAGVQQSVATHPFLLRRPGAPTTAGGRIAVGDVSANSGGRHTPAGILPTGTGPLLARVSSTGGTGSRCRSRPASRASTSSTARWPSSAKSCRTVVSGGVR